MIKKDCPIQTDCVVCVNEKQRRESYRGELANSSEEPTIHVNIYGPMAS